MKLSRIKLKIVIYCMALYVLPFNAVMSAPINYECEGTTNPATQDCPNDPFVISYEMDFMNFSLAWDKAYGTARVAIIDDYVNNSALYSNEFGSRVRAHNTGHFSFFSDLHPFIWEPSIGSPEIVSHYISGGVLQTNDGNEPLGSRHGDMVLSLLGSKANNGIGMASTCRECSISFYTARQARGTQNLPQDTAFNRWKRVLAMNLHYYRALNTSILTGNQVINRSGFFSDENFPRCQSQEYSEQLICDTLRMAKDFDTIIVASNGNNRTYANWPANETEMVIGVGGSDKFARIWDRYRDDGSCPIQNDGTILWGECGSQTYADSIMAPAKDIMVYHHNGSYNPVIGCAEFSSQYPGYQTCSGTSFSAPIISGVVAIMRSLNPLLSFDEVQELLKTSRVYFDAEKGLNYSIPNIASILKKNVLGDIDGVKIANRLKPMFRLNTRFSQSGNTKNNYLSTSIPQVAATAMKGYYLADVNESSGLLSRSHLYNVDSSEPLAIGYPKFREPDAAIKPNNARAPFYIFGGHENPFTGEDDMVPLYHFALKSVISNYPECYDLADHAYGTSSDTAFTINEFIRCNYTDTRYVLEGIEGYLLPNCPKGQVCYEDNNDEDSPQCLMMRYSSTDNSYALLMESELNKAKFSTYTNTVDNLYGMEDAECLGYVYPNIDSDNDLIINGMELVLGTDPNDADSDNDGFADGVEYPPTSPVVSDPLDASSY